MDAYLNIDKQPLAYDDSRFDRQLRSRREASLMGQAATITNEQNVRGGSEIIIKDDSTTCQLPCNRVLSETFVIDSDGLSVEIVGNLEIEPNQRTDPKQKTEPRSFLLYVPAWELNDKVAQEAYNLVYDVDDECKAMGGRSAGVREVIKPNRWVDATDKTPPQNTPPQTQSAGTGIRANSGYQSTDESDDIVVPKRGTYARSPSMAPSGGNALIDKLLGGTQNAQLYGGVDSYATRRGAMDTNNGQQQYGAMQPQQAAMPSYDWTGNSWNGMQGTVTSGLGSNPNADFNQMRSMMDELITRMSNNTSSSKKEIDDLNAKYTQQLIKNEQVNQQLIKAQDENNALHDTLNGYTSQIADKDRSLAELQKTIAAAAEARESLQGELDATKAKLEQTRKESQGHIDTANAAVDAMRTQLTSAQSQVKALNDTIRMKDEQAQKDADSISSLQATIRSERSKSSKLSNDLVAARDSVDAARNAVKAQYEQRLADMTKDLDEARKNAKDTEAFATQSMHELSEKTMNHIKEQQESFNAERDRLKKQIADMSSLLDSVTNDRDSLRSQISLVSRSMSTTRDKLNASETNVKDLESELADAKQRADAVAERNDRLTQQLESAQQAVDIARNNAENTSRYAAQKYAEAIKQRDTCENTLSAMRDAMREHDVDPAVIAIVDQALSDIMGTKSDDNPMLLAAAANDNADDVFNVNGRYMSDDDINDAASDIASQYADDTTDDEPMAAETDATDDSDDHIDVDVMAETPETHGDTDDDYAFPTDASDEDYSDVPDGDDEIATEPDSVELDDDATGDSDNDDKITVPERVQHITMDDISDVDLAGTPLSGTGVIDASQIESMLDMDDDYDMSDTH